MGRRYLTISEVELLLKRGKVVEAFLGGFSHEGQKCISWLSVSKSEDDYIGELWHVYDQGSADYLDVYTFDCVVSEYPEPIKVHIESSIESLLERFAIESANFVNAGIVQDEYADYMKPCT